MIKKLLIVVGAAVLFGAVSASSTVMVAGADQPACNMAQTCW